MDIVTGSRKVESAAVAAGRVVLFYAAFVTLIRGPDEWPHVASTPCCRE
jgi:hypothetical protein